MTVNDRQEPALAVLKARTHALLRTLRSRREAEITNRKSASGYWIICHRRIRSIADYDRIARFPRGGSAARRIAEDFANRLLAEARRYADADYEEVRRNLYPRRSAR